MEKDDLIDKLENMHKPEIKSDSHQLQLRMTLLNAKRSARVGVLIAIIPVLFLSGIFLKYLLHLNFPAFTLVENWMSDMDKTPFLKWLVPLVLIGAPLLALGLNILAIIHVEWRRESREIFIVCKVKWANILVIGICLTILTCFLFYVIGENCR